MMPADQFEQLYTSRRRGTSERVSFLSKSDEQAARRLPDIVREPGTWSTPTAERPAPAPARGTMTHVETLRACGYDPVVRWVCQVVRSGRHNGAGCGYDDPHTEWGCCYRVELSIPLSGQPEANREVRS